MPTMFSIPSRTIAKISFLALFQQEPLPR
jgi:hypothetical protein